MPQFPLAYVSNNYHRPPNTVQVERTEEKGSDVNLASMLLCDCFDQNYDNAVVISNDADLAKPIELVTQRYGKDVMLINPHRKKNLSHQLANAATNYFPSVNINVYKKCQFPTQLSDAQGTFTKPPTW